MNFIKLFYKNFSSSFLKSKFTNLSIKRICNETPNIFYKKEKILGYHIIPEKMYNLLISKNFK